MRNDRADDVVKFEVAVVSFFIDAAELFGVPKSVAAIYGICFASPEPLSFTEIHQRLDISQGSISQGLRVLRDIGALKACENTLFDSGRISSASRSARQRERYSPDLELRSLIIRWLDGRLERQLDAGSGKLAAIAKAIPAHGDVSAKLLINRFQALQNWHNKSRALFPVIKTFMKLT